jgi:hypothetical protein
MLLNLLSVCGTFRRGSHLFSSALHFLLYIAYIRPWPSVVTSVLSHFPARVLFSRSTIPMLWNVQNYMRSTELKNASYVAGCTAFAV